MWFSNSLCSPITDDKFTNKIGRYIYDVVSQTQISDIPIYSIKYKKLETAPKTNIKFFSTLHNIDKEISL